VSVKPKPYICTECYVIGKPRVVGGPGLGAGFLALVSIPVGVFFPPAFLVLLAVAIWAGVAKHKDTCRKCTSLAIRLDSPRGQEIMQKFSIPQATYPHQSYNPGRTY